MAEGEVDPAGGPDQTVEQLDADARPGDGPPPSLERGKALLEGTDEVDGGAPQLGPRRLRRAAQPARQPVVAVEEDGERLVHKMGRMRLAAPVDGELDSLVDDAAARRV